MVYVALIVSVSCNLFFVCQWYRVTWHVVRLAEEMTKMLKRIGELEARGVLDVERHLAESPHLTMDAVRTLQVADGTTLTREDVRLEVLAVLMSSSWECTLQGRDGRDDAEEVKMDAAFEVAPMKEEEAGDDHRPG